MSTHEGAASGPPPAARRGHQSRAARAKKANLADDPQVIAWIASQRRQGKTHAQILTTANAGAGGWPRQGTRLSKGVLSMIDKILKHGAIPKTTLPRVKHARSREAMSRMEEAAAKLAIRSRATTALVEVSRLGATLQAALFNLDLAELNGHGDKMLKPFLDSAFTNLVDLMEMTNLRIGEFTARASEQAVRDKIAIMRNPAGRTEFEIANANAIADRLERQLGDGLKLDPGN
jgi:hypothetical protein